MRFSCSSFKIYFLNIKHFASSSLSRNFKKFRLFENDMKLRTLESRNLMPFFIVNY